MGIATYLVDPPFGSDLLGRVPPVDGAETSETLLVSFCVNAAKEEEHGFEKRNRQARRRETLTRPCRQCPSFWAPPGRSRASYPPGTARSTWARRSPRAERFASFRRRRVRPPPSRGARSQRRRWQPWPPASSADLRGAFSSASCTLRSTGPGRCAGAPATRKDADEEIGKKVRSALRASRRERKRTAVRRRPRFGSRKKWDIAGRVFDVHPIE